MRALKTFLLEYSFAFYEKWKWCFFASKAITTTEHMNWYYYQSWEWEKETVSSPFLLAESNSKSLWYIVHSKLVMTYDNVQTFCGFLQLHHQEKIWLKLESLITEEKRLFTNKFIVTGNVILHNFIITVWLMSIIFLTGWFQKNGNLHIKFWNTLQFGIETNLKVLNIKSCRLTSSECLHTLFQTTWSRCDGARFWG